jgi:hypothetical protein
VLEAVVGAYVKRRGVKIGVKILG